MIGMTFLLPEADGTFLQGELIDGQVVEQERRLFGQFKTEKGIIIGGFPLDDYEMSAYFRSPETFLGVFKQNPHRISDPYHCYEFAQQTYSKSTSEFLIENLKAWYPAPELKALSHAELVRR